MKRILLIQFRTDDSRSYEEECVLRVGKDKVTLKSVSSLDRNEGWNDPKKMIEGHDGIILGGSSEFFFSGHTDAKKAEEFDIAQKHVRQLLEHVIEKDFPSLGICFGHQTIGNFLNSKVENDKNQAKVGSFEVMITSEGKEDPLFKDVPEKFFVQYGHKDSLVNMPKESILLASGENCNFSAFRHKNNIYGLQFHPELNKEDIEYKLSLYPSYKELLKDLRDAPHAPKLLENFINNL